MSAVYQEAEDSLFQQDGQTYSLNHIFRLVHDYPISQCSVKDLEVTANGIQDMRADTLECRSCLDKAQHNERVKAADTTIPIIITRHKGDLVVVDGIHRLERAIAMDRTVVPAKYINEQELAKTKLPSQE